MNMFKNLFSKKQKNSGADHNSENVSSYYNNNFDDTVKLNGFVSENFGETVLLNGNDLSNSDETVLLNNIETKAIEKNAAKSSSNIFIINPLSGEKVRIYKQIFTVGSGNNADFRICKSSISNNHASIFIKGPDEFYITDNGSTNGTQVEGATIEPMKMISIDNGDLIAFGDELYQFYIEE